MHQHLMPCLVLQDFDSPSLKTKRHYNSFATGFFLRLGSVRAALEAHGRCDVASEELLSAELRCHRCGAPQRNMPALKAHLRTHA